MDDSEAGTKKLVSILLSTLSQAHGVDVDATLRSLKDFEVRIRAIDATDHCYHAH